MPKPRSVHDVNVFGLLRVIEELNRGDTGEGKRALKALPALMAGAVANPNRQRPGAGVGTAGAQGDSRRAVRHHSAGL